MVISRLEKETAETKEECERAADNRIKFVKTCSCENLCSANVIICDKIAK